MHKAGLTRSPSLASPSFSMTAADLLRNSTSFPKQEKEIWTQPIRLCESAKLAAAGDQNRAIDYRVLNRRLCGAHKKNYDSVLITCTKEKAGVLGRPVIL